MGLLNDYLTPKREYILINSAIFGLVGMLGAVGASLMQAQTFSLWHVVAGGISAGLTAAVAYFSSKKDEFETGASGTATPPSKRIGI